MNVSVWTRVFLRYGIGALAVWGILPEGWADIISTDPDLQMVIDLALAGALGYIVEHWMVKVGGHK